MPLSGSLLRRQREHAGLSRTQLAYIIGRSEQSVLLYEVGRVQPPVAVVERMASALGTSVDSLLAAEAVAS